MWHEGSLRVLEKFLSLLRTLPTSYTSEEMYSEPGISDNLASLA